MQGQRLQDPSFLKPVPSASQAMNTSFFAPVTMTATMAKRMDSGADVTLDDAEKMSILHSRVRQETDKLRKWQFQTEMDLKKKDQKIIESTQTIECLRKSSLELQIQNEHLSMKLQEEIDNRDELVQKISATRDMCNLLKDYAAKVEDRIQKCETERTELKYLEKEHMKQCEELTDKFKELEITATEKINNLRDGLEKEKQEKIGIELDFDAKLKNAEVELQEMVELSEDKSVDIDAISEQLSTEQEKVNRLTEEYDTIKSQLMDMTNVSIHQEQKLLDTNKEMMDLKESFMKETEELNVVKDSLNRTIELQKTDLDDLQATYQICQDKLFKYEEDLSQKNKSVDCLMKQASENEEDLNNVRDELKEALDREKQCYNKLDKLKTQMDEVSLNLQSTQTQLEEETQQTQLVQEQVDSLNKEIADLKTHIEKSKQNEQELLTEKQCLQEELDKLRLELQNLKADAKTQVEAMSKLKEELSHLDEARSSVTEAVRETEQAAVEHQANRTKLIAVLDNYKLEQDKIVWDQAQQITRLKQNLDDAKEKMTEQITLQAEIERLKEDHNKEANQQEKNCADLQQQLQQTTEELEEKTSCLKELSDKEKDRAKQEKKQTDKFARLEEEFNKKQEKLTKQLEKAKEEIKILKEREKQKNKKIKELEKNYTKQGTELQKEREKNLNNLQESQRQVKYNMTEVGNQKNECKTVKKPKIMEEKSNSPETENTKQQSLKTFEMETNEEPPTDRLTKEPTTDRLTPVPATDTVTLAPVTDRVTKHPRVSVPVELCVVNPEPESCPMDCASQESNSPKPLPHVPVTPQRKINAKTHDGQSGLATPQSILRRPLRTPTSIMSKKRRVAFMADDDDSDSCSLVEVESDGLGMTLKCTTPSGATKSLLVRPSPKVPPSPGTRLMDTPRQRIPLKSLSVTNIQSSPAVREPRDKKTQLKPIQRGSPGKIEVQQTKKVKTSDRPYATIKQTPKHCPRKIFRTPPKERSRMAAKKDSIKDDVIPWFDSDAVFGFGSED